jgi:hypothetical protein
MKEERMTDVKQHKFYKRAYDAHRGTSFDPDRRAEQECASYDATIKELTEAGKTDAIEKFDRLYAHQLACKARIVSSMIAGPARFPVARMEKYNRWEHASTERLLAFFEALNRPPAPPRTESTTRSRTGFNSSSPVSPMTKCANASRVAASSGRRVTRHGRDSSHRMRLVRLSRY